MDRFEKKMKFWFKFFRKKYYACLSSQQPGSFFMKGRS